MYKTGGGVLCGAHTPPPHCTRRTRRQAVDRHRTAATICRRSCPPVHRRESRKVFTLVSSQLTYWPVLRTHQAQQQTFLTYTRRTHLVGIMRYAVTSSTKTLVGVVVIFCCLQAALALASEDAAKQDTDQNDQLEMSKRSWAKGNPSMMHSWGKRAWQNLQGGWGKRDLWGPSNSYPLYMSSDKRAWQNLQGGWGKRFATDEEYAAKLAALLSDEELQQRLADFNDANANYNGGADGGDDFADNDDEKRAWRSLNNAGWGKRAAQWGSFRGSWGKRDPAWTNLKGIWGKRSADKAQ